jgi:hypothetical protein
VSIDRLIPPDYGHHRLFFSSVLSLFFMLVHCFTGQGTALLDPTSPQAQRQTDRLPHQPPQDLETPAHLHERSTRVILAVQGPLLLRTESRTSQRPAAHTSTRHAAIFSVRSLSPSLTLPRSHACQISSFSPKLLHTPHGSHTCALGRRSR